MKNFNICASLKNLTFREEILQKNPIKRRDCIKKGAWTVCRFKGGGEVSRKRGWTNLNLKEKARPFLEGPEKGATL